MKRKFREKAAPNCRAAGILFQDRLKDNTLSELQQLTPQFLTTLQSVVKRRGEHRKQIQNI